MRVRRLPRTHLSPAAGAAGLAPEGPIAGAGRGGEGSEPKWRLFLEKEEARTRRRRGARGAAPGGSRRGGARRAGARARPPDLRAGSGSGARPAGGCAGTRAGGAAGRLPAAPSGTEVGGGRAGPGRQGRGRGRGVRAAQAARRAAHMRAPAPPTFDSFTAGGGGQLSRYSCGRLAAGGRGGAGSRGRLRRLRGAGSRPGRLPRRPRRARPPCGGTPRAWPWRPRASAAPAGLGPPPGAAPGVAGSWHVRPARRWGCWPSTGRPASLGRGAQAAAPPWPPAPGPGPCGKLVRAGRWTDGDRRGRGNEGEGAPAGSGGPAPRPPPPSGRAPHPHSAPCTLQWAPLHCLGAGHKRWHLRGPPSPRGPGDPLPPGRHEALAQRPGEGALSGGLGPSAFLEVRDGEGCVTPGGGGDVLPSLPSPTLRRGHAGFRERPACALRHMQGCQLSP